MDANLIEALFRRVRRLQTLALFREAQLRNLLGNDAAATKIDLIYNRTWTLAGVTRELGKACREARRELREMENDYRLESDYCRNCGAI